jgi:hypothetical protein
MTECDSAIKPFLFLSGIGGLDDCLNTTISKYLHLFVFLGFAGYGEYKLFWLVFTGLIGQDLSGQYQKYKSLHLFCFDVPDF